MLWVVSCCIFPPKQVGYEDQGRIRPVLYRASLVEMCVPYGSPDFPYTRKVWQERRSGCSRPCRHVSR